MEKQEEEEMKEQEEEQRERERERETERETGRGRGRGRKRERHLISGLILFGKAWALNFSIAFVKDFSFFSWFQDQLWKSLLQFL